MKNLTIKMAPLIICSVWIGLISFRLKMALFPLSGVLRGVTSSTYKSTPRRNSLCGLAQRKNCSFSNWKLICALLIIGWALIGCADVSGSQNIDGTGFSGSWYKTGFWWPHDGNPVESTDCIVYSDGASTKARQTLAQYAEDVLDDIMQAFEIESHDIFLYPPGQEKIDIYAYKLRFPQAWGGWGYYGGFMIFSLDHPERKQIGHTAPEIYIPVIAHELTHVVQSLLIGDDDPGLVDIWLTEGLAEAVSGGTAGGSITDLNQLNELRQQYGWSLNPISMHQYNYPDVDGIVYYYYYPMFQLAVEYLVDINGHGKSFGDIKNLFTDVSVGEPFQTAFENNLGISVEDFELQFFDLMNDYLP